MNQEKKLRKKIEMLEKELRSQKYFFESILSVMPGHIYWLDTNNTYLGCNNQQALDAGLSSRYDIVGKTNDELPWKAQAKELNKANKEVLATGKALKKTEQAIVSNQVRTYMTEKMALRDEYGDISGLVGISVDITKLTEREKQLKIAVKKAEAADNAKAEFIANMSHDIRTPLSGIIGMSNLLEQVAQSKEAKENAHMLNVSGEQLLTLLNSILDMIATGSQKENKVNLSQFNPKELINNVAELELPTIKLKDLALELKLSDDLPQIIESDPIKIHRILLNLLGNAVKFTEKGKIEISAEIKNSATGSPLILLYVKDSGVGIRPEDKQKVFKKFYKGNASYHGFFTGHGVGLHIVKRYTNLLKGKITIDSEAGQGTKITIKIPVKVIKQQKITPTPQKISPQLITHKRKNSNKKTIKILLIEDNPVALKMAETLLTQMGLSFETAANGKKALKLFQQYSFDMVLSDLGLPDIQGAEVCRQLRIYEQEHRKKSIPMIGLTAHSVTAAGAQKLPESLNQILTKPIRHGMISELLRNYHLDEQGTSNNRELMKNTLPASSSPSNIKELPLMDEALAISSLGSKEEVKNLISIMLEQSIPDAINSIEAHYNTKNWQGFKKAVHKLKSSCMYCATTRLLQHSQNLENLADSQNTTLINFEYENFLACLTLTQTHLENWLESFDKAQKGHSRP